MFDPHEWDLPIAKVLVDRAFRPTLGDLAAPTSQRLRRYATRASCSPASPQLSGDNISTTWAVGVGLLGVGEMVLSLELRILSDELGMLGSSAQRSSSIRWQNPTLPTQVGHSSGSEEIHGGRASSNAFRNCCPSTFFNQGPIFSGPSSLL